MPEFKSSDLTTRSRCLLEKYDFILKFIATKMSEENAPSRVTPVLNLPTARIAEYVGMHVPQIQGTN